MDLSDLLDLQERRCGACREPLDGGRCIDHCHDTGLLRGWLCPSCNMAEGHEYVPGVLPPEVRERWTWDWYRRNPPARRADILWQLDPRPMVEPTWADYDAALARREMEPGPPSAADREAAAIIGAKLSG